MSLQKIISGKNKVQILDSGFRMQWNRGPQGPNQTTYFTCVEKGCKATLATMGALDSDLTLKYHRLAQHTHRADPSSNIVSATLHEFRDEIKTNPDQPVKRLFEELTTKAMETVIGTPDKLDLAKKLPTFRSGMSYAYNDTYLHHQK